MIKTGETLIPTLEGGTGLQTWPKIRRPDLALRVRSNEAYVRGSSFPAAGCPNPIRGAVISIRWPPEMSWPKKIHSLRPV